MLQEEIRKLEQELKQKKELLHSNQLHCIHEWSEPKYDPESYLHPIFDHYEPHGSDPEPIYTYITKQKDRWSRYCKKCEKTEYTFDQRPVKFVPNFK